MPDAPSNDRENRILAVAGQWWRQRRVGNVASEAELFGTHPELMPELADRIQLLQRLGLETATDRAILPIGPSPESKPTARSRIIRSRGAQRRLLDVPGTAERWFSPGVEIARRYTISCYLGEGGLGAVFLAYDKVLNKPVALKFFRDSVLLENRRHIEAEVALSQRISHVNVCRVHDLDVNHDPMFLSMEYIDGEDLDRTLLRVGRVMEERALQISLEICAGLAAAHENGVIHRDLKPQNVMIDSAGIARITDFGLGRLSVRTEAQEYVVGTPQYMAPEQSDGRDATERSDLFSLGIVLYELFTGEYPIDLDEEWDVPPWQTSRVVPPSDIVPQIDSQVERTILKCLELAPEDRPTSAKDVLRALSGDRAERSQSHRLTSLGGSNSLIREFGHELELASGKNAAGFQYDSPFLNDASAANQTVSYWFRQSPSYMVPRHYTISRELSN